MCIIYVLDELEIGALDLDHQDQIGLQSCQMGVVEAPASFECEKGPY